MTGPESDYTSPVPGMAIWGWMTEPELLWLAARAAEMDSVAEIGCLHGRSAFALLTACPGPVYCIDPWNDEADRSYPSFMRSCGQFENLTAIREYSPQAASLVPDVDMVFLDGSHEYGAVIADIAAWLPKTRRLICGHDYQTVSAGFPGVAEAVHAVFGEDRVTVEPETAIWAIDLEADRSVLPDAPTGKIVYVDEYEHADEVLIEWPA